MVELFNLILYPTLTLNEHLTDFLSFVAATLNNMFDLHIYSLVFLPKAIFKFGVLGFSSQIMRHKEFSQI